MDKKRLISDVKWCIGQGYSMEETVEFVASLASDVSRTDIASLYTQLKAALEHERIQNIPDRRGRPPATQSETKTQASQPKTTLIGAIFIIAVMSITLTMCNTMCKSISNQPKTDSSYLNDRVYCYVAAQEYAEKLLVSPASATFSFDPLIRSRKESEGVFVYYIDSYVDSQNAFGAVLRTKFSASVRYFVKQDKWDVYQFEFY